MLILIYFSITEYPTVWQPRPQLLSVFFCRSAHAKQEHAEEADKLFVEYEL